MIISRRHPRCIDINYHYHQQAWQSSGCGCSKLSSSFAIITLCAVVVRYYSIVNTHYLLAAWPADQVVLTQIPRVSTGQTLSSALSNRGSPESSSSSEHTPCRPWPPPQDRYPRKTSNYQASTQSCLGHQVRARERR